MLTEVGINVDLLKVVANCLSQSTLNNVSSENATNILVLIRKCMKVKKKFMSCTRANKGIHHVINMVAFWFTNRVCTILLDSDAVTGDNVNTALGIKYSLNKLDELVEDGVEKVTISGLSTDAGGKGTWEGLTQQISKLNRCCNIYISCSHLCTSSYESHNGNTL